MYRCLFFFLFQLLLLNAFGKGKIIHHVITDKAEVNEKRGSNELLAMNQKLQAMSHALRTGNQIKEIF